jgi:large subunit ribosomal protein L25
MATTKTKGHTQQTLTVQRRDAAGSGAAGRLRGTGLVPGIVYGKKTKPLAIAAPARELAKLLHSKTGEHSLVTLRLEGDNAWEHPALVKAVQHDPVDGHLVHVDFHAITLTERIRVKVPVTLLGEPAGVKQEGGVLEQFLREVEVECLPTEMPGAVELDVSALAIGQAVHVRDLPPPKNAKLLTDPNGVVASVQAVKVEAAAEAAPAEVTEPEVIREKKPPAEGEEALEPGKGKAPEPKAKAEGKETDEKKKGDG